MLEDGIINFFYRKKEYRSLSNFWEGDIRVSERTYESGEHCFHGEKYIRIGEHCTDEIRKNVLLEYGKTFMKPSLYGSGATCKKMGGKRGLVLTDSELVLWHDISIRVQKEICIWKIENYKEVRCDLLKSGDKILIHPAMRCSEENLKTRLWEGKGVMRDGCVAVIGKNMLGNIWMELRNGYIVGGCIY